MITKLKKDEVKILWLMVIIHSFILFYACGFSKTLRVYGDELIYFNIAKCLAEGRSFVIHGRTLNFTNIAYPLVISPFFFIKNVFLRVHFITFFNSFLMSLSIVPVWLICKELQVNKKNRWLIIGVVMIYPSIFMASTFMSENLYWPLTLFAYYYILRIIKYGKNIDALVAGALSFLCYFCKEVGVCIFLAVVVWFFVSPVDLFLFERTSFESNREHFIKYYIKHFEWKNFFAYIFTYVMFYLIVNNLFLAEVTSAYSGVTGAVSHVVGIIDLSKMLYILYGVLLYLVYSLIAFFAVPIIYPIMSLKEMNHVTRKIYFYSLILLMGTILTIVCTITINENYGNVVTRAHMRYFASMIGLWLPIYGSVLSSEKQKTKYNKLWITLGVFCLFLIFIFKGIAPGSPVDCLELGYVANIQGKFKVINIGELNIYTVSIACSIFLTIAMILGYSVGKIKIKYTYYLFYIIAVIICVLNLQEGFKVIKNNYSVPEAYLHDMERINDYFIDNSLEGKNVLFVCKDRESTKERTFDTYFEGKQPYLVKYDVLLGILKNSESNTISDYIFEEPVFENTFQLDSIDYFITEFDGFDYLVENVECIESISSENYSVYKNKRPMDLCYLPLSLPSIIDLTEDGYMPLAYNIKGISTPEKTFSWTDGNELLMSCDFPKEIAQVKVQINIAWTYGMQNFVVYQNDSVVSQGSISDSGRIIFDLAVEGGNCSFRMTLPDAVSPYSLGVSEDKRDLALAISSIEFIAKE